LRTAAYAVAITRLNDHYTASGLIVWIWVW
jgi:hypothetical protein